MLTTLLLCKICENWLHTSSVCKSTIGSYFTSWIRPVSKEILKTEGYVKILNWVFFISHFLWFFNKSKIQEFFKVFFPIFLSFIWLHRIGGIENRRDKWYLEEQKSISERIRVPQKSFVMIFQRIASKLGVLCPFASVLCGYNYLFIN